MIGRHDGNAGNRKERIDMQNEVWSEIGAFLNDLRCGNVNRKTYLHFPELEEAEQLLRYEGSDRTDRSRYVRCRGNRRRGYC